MKYKFDNIWLGLVAGLIAPLLALFVYYLAAFNYLTPRDFIVKMIWAEVLIQLISLFVIINLLLFFIFYWLKKDRSANGVIFATIVYAIVIFALKL